MWPTQVVRLQETPAQLVAQLQGCLPCNRGLHKEGKLLLRWVLVPCLAAKLGRWGHAPTMGPQATCALHVPIEVLQFIFKQSYTTMRLALCQQPRSCWETHLHSTSFVAVL